MLKSSYTAGQKLFCESLRHARVRAGLSQTELAARLSEPQSFVSRFERGERRLDVVEYIQVANAIGIDPATHLRKVVKSIGDRIK